MSKMGDCDNCEDKCRGTEACGYYQDLEGDKDTQIKRLTAHVEMWKELAKSRYTKMVDARLRIKELEGELSGLSSSYLKEWP